MVKVCAFVTAILFALPLQAVEVFPDGSGKIAVSDLIGNHIVIGDKTWSDWSFSATSGGGVTTPVASDIYFYPDAELGTYFPQANYNGVFFWDISTHPLPQTAQATINYSVTAASGNIARVESLLLDADSGSSVPTTFSDITTKVYDSNPTLVATAQNTVGGLGSSNPTISSFSPISSIDVETTLTANGARITAAAVDFIAEAETGNSVDIATGYRRRGGVLGGSLAINGVDVLFDRVTTQGTFTASLTTQDIEDVPQSLLDILPFEPGETFTSWDFSFDGEFESDDLGLGGGYVGKGFTLQIKYDEDALGFDENLLRIWHEDTPGNWVPLLGPVDTVNNIVYGRALHFSAFALGGDGGVPEPSSGLLMLFGLFMLRIKRRGFLASIAAMFCGAGALKDCNDGRTEVCSGLADRHDNSMQKRNNNLYYRVGTSENGWTFILPAEWRPHPDLARKQKIGSNSETS